MPWFARRCAARRIGGSKFILSRFELNRHAARNPDDVLASRDRGKMIAKRFEICQRHVETRDTNRLIHSGEPARIRLDERGHPLGHGRAASSALRSRRARARHRPAAVCGSALASNDRPRLVSRRDEFAPQRGAQRPDLRAHQIDLTRERRHHPDRLGVAEAKQTNRRVCR